MGFLDEERKRLLNQKESGGSGNGSALSFLDRERTRLNTGLSLSPDGQSKLKAQQQRKTTVESKVPNIGDPTAALRNLPKQIQDGMAGPDPGPNASQEERDAWAMKKMKEDVAKIQREKNQKVATPPAPAPQKNGFFDTIGNLFNPKSYSPDNIPKNLETPQLKPVREALGFAENTVDSATFGALPFAFDQARKIPGSQYLLNSQANTDITSRAAEAQKGTPLGTTAELLGALAPYAGAYKATGGLARTLNAGRGPIASNFVRGTLAGAAYGAANETGEAAFGKNNQSFTGRLQDIGISAALGGAGDAAVSAALPFLGRAAQKYLPGFRSTPDAPANPLALPPGRSPGVQNRMNAAAQRSVNAPGTNPIAEPYTFGLPSAARSVDDVLRAPDPQQLATSRSGARVNEEYQKLRASVQTQRAAGQPTPTNRELYEQAKARVDEVPEPVRPESPAVQAAQPQIAAPRTAAPTRPAATVEAYDRALANGDTEAMRQIAPDIAEKMAAYPGDLSQIPTFLRGKMYNQLGINKRAPSNLPRKADLAPAPNRTPEPRINAQTGPQPRSMVDQPVPTPQVPQRPVNPLMANADIKLGPEVNQGGLGIIPGQARGLDPYVAPLNDTRSQIRSRASINTQDATDPAFYKAAADRFYQNWVDDLSPIKKKIDKTIERVTGRKLDESESPYNMALAGRGDDIKARQIIKNGMMDSQGNVIGKSFEEALIPVKSSRELVLLEDYLLNKHAPTRAERGEKTFKAKIQWTPQKGANKVAAYERDYPHFKQVAEDLYTFQRQLVENTLVDSGVISRAEAQAWFDANPYYIPNKRYFSPLEKGNRNFGGGKKGIANPSNPVKGYNKGEAFEGDISKATAEDIARMEGGSERDIISPIEAMIENVDAFVKVANRNKTMQQIYKYVTTYPDDFADFATVVRKNDEQLPKKEIEELVANLNMDYDKGTQKFKMDGDNIVRLQLNGQTVRLQINDKPFLESITAMGPQNSAFLLEMIGAVTNNFKKLTTGSNPVFAFTRNVPRDFVQGYVSSKTTNNPFMYFSDYAQSIASIMWDPAERTIRNKTLGTAFENVGRKVSDAGNKAFDPEIYRLYKNVGGGHSSSVSADRNLLAQTKRQAIGKKGPLNGLKRINDTYDNVMNAVESAPRLGEFKRTLKSGGTTQKALYNASDLTVNFKRKGRIAREFDKVFPYFNAAIQGMDQFARLYANPATRGKAIAKGIVSVTIPTALLYLYNRENPRYQMLTDREKDAYFHFPKEDGTFTRVAKTQEIANLFSNGVERAMRALDGEGNEAFRGFADRLRTTMVPPGIGGFFKDTDFGDKLFGDTIGAPIVQMMANKNFAGSPIVPGYLERLSPELQKDAKTSKIGEILAEAPLIGKISDNSPKKMDHLLKSYLGFIGQFGTAATSPGTGLGKALEQQVSVDPTFSNDISNEFYDYKTKLDQAFADRESKELPDWYSDGIRLSLNKVSQNMSDVRSVMRSIQDDDSLSRQEKEVQLREYQEIINEIAEQGNELARGYIPRK